MFLDCLRDTGIFYKCESTGAYFLSHTQAHVYTQGYFVQVSLEMLVLNESNVK